MIRIYEVRNEAFEALIKKFDESIDNLKTQFNIELRTYGNFLRVILNNIQSDAFINLIERVNVNQELERALDNSGGYSIDFLGEYNPKECLLKIMRFLQTVPLKLQQLLCYLNNDNNTKTIIADTNDIDFLTQHISNKRFKVISPVELKRNLCQYENLVFYSFNGKKDFDFIYNLDVNISLVLYSQEKQLYNCQLQKRKQLIEEEVRSNDRQSICMISYEPVPDLSIHLSQTIEKIANRIDSFGKKAYENYMEETDTLLEEIEDKIIYKLCFDNRITEFLDSNETVFTANGDLVKVYHLKLSDEVRIYPREQFAEKLYQVAVETDAEVFGKVEVNSLTWRKILLELKLLYKEKLYDKLKAKGIRVLPATVEGYFNGQRKFPMFNSDLKAIYKLKYPDKDEKEIDSLVAPIRWSKSTYNSTMIALGRGLKQEVRLFLKEKRIGEILSKLKFTAATLQAFIDEFMPLCTITKKEVAQDVSEQLQISLIQHIEL